MSENKVVVIVGGNFLNKGAELMTSTAINIVKLSGKNTTPVIVDSFPGCTRKTEYEGAMVLSVPFYMNFIYCMIKRFNFSPTLLLRTVRMSLGSIRRGFLLKDIKSGILMLRLIKKAEYIIDISGYGYNSNSGIMNYIQLSFSNVASRKNVPYIYFPQSFGVFDKNNSLINLQIKGAIEAAAYIFCRENLSMKEITNLTDSYSGEYWPDIALLYGGKPVLNDVSENIDMNLVENSVVLIPNARLFDKYGENESNNLYSTLVSIILNLGCKVTILKHSVDDAYAVRKIQQKFPNKIYVLDNDYDLNTIDSIISTSRLVISGRYHGLVVSLKNSIPCMAVGWAHKYDELLELYGLQSYYFDLSKDIDADNVYSQINDTINNSLALAKQIKKTNDILLNKYPLSKFISLYNSNFHWPHKSG